MSQETGGPGSTPIVAHHVGFTGSGGEYFRLWVINLLLTIVTLSLYTPFARRRTAQYFWGHTIVAGTPLEFVAEKRKMFTGFLLLVLLYVAFKIAASTGQDGAVAIFTLGGAALAPWFWGSAMRFRLNATRWRGIRLRFAAGWGEIYVATWPVFVIAGTWLAVSILFVALAGPGRRSSASLPVAAWLAPLAALVVTFLCVVRLEFNAKSLLVRRGHIGTQPGHWKPVYGDFLRVWLATLGLLVLTLVLVGIATALMFGGVLASVRGGSAGRAILLLIFVGIAFVVMLLLASAPARAYREARMFQLVWGNVGVSRVARFRCELVTREFVLLRLRNMLLLVVTLGFWRPFALVSEYRMKVDSVSLHVKGGLDQLTGQLAREQEGLGDAIADLAGLDLVG